jgi:hypothetical protein
MVRNGRDVVILVSRGVGWRRKEKGDVLQLLQVAFIHILKDLTGCVRSSVVQ